MNSAFFRDNLTEAPVVWLSHRAATRRRLGSARAQPGWWLDLDGPSPLDTPLTLAHLRERADVVRAVLDASTAATRGRSTDMEVLPVKWQASSPGR